MISKQEEKLYFRSIRQGLQVPRQNKRDYLETIRQQFDELSDSHLNATMDDVYAEIGAPEELIRTYESREDFERLKKKYKRGKIICLAVVIPLVAIAIFTTIVASIVVYDSLHTRNAYIKETIHDGIIIPIEDDTTEVTDE